MKNMTKKAVVKKVTKKVDETYKEFQKLAVELDQALKSAKRQYAAIDPNTKKQIIAGIAGTVAVVVGAIGLSKMSGKKKKK